MHAHSDAWLAITGEYAAAKLAKTCGVYMRDYAFAIGDVAQTSVARTNGVVIRNDIADLPVYHVLEDSASAEYMWSCLLDAMAEWEGQPIGLDCLV